MSVPPARGVFARADPPADPRADRFASSLTAVVALVVLLTSNEALLAAQAVVFAVGALLGLRFAPYHAVFRFVVRRVRTPGARWSAPALSARPEPYRFAQAAGLAVALLGTLGYLTGLDPAGPVAAAVLLLGSVANAVTGFGSAELYSRLTKPSTSS